MIILTRNVVHLKRFHNTLKISHLRSFSHFSTGEVLRSTAGKLTLIPEETLNESFFPFDIKELADNTQTNSNKDLTSSHNEVKSLNLRLNESETSPVIDFNTFKNYLMIPPLGIRSYFSSDLVKINENKNILYKEYVPGSLAAHNYPLQLLPKTFSRRVDPDIFVKTFTEDDRNFRIVNSRKIKLSLSPGLKVHDSYPLLHKVSGNLSLLFIFSGDLPNCQYNSVQRWLSFPGISKKNLNISSETQNQLQKHTEKNNLNVSVVLNSPCNLFLGWAYNRYLEALARTVVEENTFMSITRKLSIDSIISLHQYRRQLPSVLLLDPSGYIRWHAIGHPTSESVYILNRSIAKLQSEI